MHITKLSFNFLIRKIVFISFLCFFTFMQINGMEGDSKETETTDLSALKAYYELRGRQVERCLSIQPFSIGNKVRWVANLDLLWGSKRIIRNTDFNERFSGQEWVWSRDPRYIRSKEIHQKIGHIGAMLKILNGYYYGKESEELWNGITPGKRNFLVPFVNFIVKYNKEEPCFEAGSYLYSNDAKATVFVSGKGNYTDKEALETSFNNILKDPDEPEISIKSGEDILTASNISWGLSKDHTEYFLVAYTADHHEIILNPLQKLKERSNDRVAYLKAIILDVHSWLDICDYCYPCFFSQWNAVINSPPFLEKIKDMGFILPKNNIVKVIIRMSSEAKPKDYYRNLSDLSCAGGGINIFERGFDAKVLASQQVILATRRDLKDKDYRDELIKEFWQKHLEACLYNPYEFWLQNPKNFSNICVLSQHRSAQDMLALLAKLHPHEGAFSLASAKAFIDNNCLVNCSIQKIETISIPLVSIIESPLQDNPKVSKLLESLQYTNIQDTNVQKKYARVFYGNLCLALMEKSIRENVGITRTVGFINKFIQYTLENIDPIIIEEEKIIQELVTLAYRLPSEKNTYNMSMNAIERYENKHREKVRGLILLCVDNLKKELGYDYWCPNANYHAYEKKSSNQELDSFFQKFNTKVWLQGDSTYTINELFKIARLKKSRGDSSYRESLEGYAKKGHSGAQYMLAMEIATENGELSMDLLHQSAAQSYPPALYQLGIAFCSKSKLFDIEPNAHISELLLNEAKKLGYQEDM